MTRVRFSPRARNDLDDIWLFIANDSVMNADRFIERLVMRCRDTLSVAPNAGRRREELGLGLRSFVIENYVVFYQHRNNIVDILRIIHAKRDLRGVFGLE